MKNFTRCVKILSVFLLALLTGVGLQGQNSTANYTFATNTTGSLVLDANSNAIDMSTGTTQLVAANSDDVASSVTTIGFDYYLYGSKFTQFSTNSNGLIVLGSTVVSSSAYATSSGTTTSPRLSPFNADLSVGPAGKVHYKVVGTAPNRCLVIEFLNMSLLYLATPTNDGTYQARLYETSGVLEYVYGAMSRNAGTSASTSTVSIGFSVGSALNTTASVTTSTNTVANTATFNTNTYTASSGAITNLNSAADGSRRVYKFTPGAVPADPITMTFTAVTPTATTVNWVDNSTTEATFLVTRATDAAFTANVVTSTVNSTTRAATGGAYASAAQTGLSANTTYYYKVQAIGEGTVPAQG